MSGKGGERGGANMYRASAFLESASVDFKKERRGGA